MERILTWVIPPNDSGRTVTDYLRSRGCSHHVLTHLKRTPQGILCNGEWAYTNRRLVCGDTLTIHLSETEGSEGILPYPVPFGIVYEDEDLLVIDKSADTPIHPSIHNYSNTLANGLVHYFNQQGIPFVYRCINRLDRDTSGLLIIAKNMLSGAILSKMSAERKIHREYLAITEGVLPASGTIDAPIARACDSAIERCVDYIHGEHAVTHYKRLLHFSAEIPAQPAVFSNDTARKTLTLASVRLETGRTHQIRVHMKHIGHPLIGDFLYNPASTSLMQRQALHSYRLSFCHPITGKELVFMCELPEDMKRLLPHDNQNTDAARCQAALFTRTL